MSDQPHQLHHVGIVVRNLEASVAWYREHLDLEPQGQPFSFPGARAIFIGRDSLRLELFQIEGAASMAPEREQAETNLKIGGINHLAISVENMEQVILEMKRKGVEIVRPPSDVPNNSGWRFAFVRDNERMLIELFEQL